MTRLAAPIAGKSAKVALALGLLLYVLKDLIDYPSDTPGIRRVLLGFIEVEALTIIWSEWIAELMGARNAVCQETMVENCSP